MSYRSVMLTPTGDIGYAFFFENPQDGSAIVNVMTKNYVQRVLPLGNIMFAQQLGIPEPKPEDYKTLDQIVKFTHDVMIRRGYKDRTPHVVELVDTLYDFDERKYKETNDVQTSLIQINKHYQLHAGGTFMVPSYPDLVPAGLPILPFMPLPTSPI